MQLNISCILTHGLQGNMLCETDLDLSFII